MLAAAGFRVVAPDLVGFGRSDKPAEVADHSYARHVEWVRALAFDTPDLTGVTLVGQDWGGLIGLRLVAEHPDRFDAVVAANTGLPTGEQDMPQAWACCGGCVHCPSPTPPRAIRGAVSNVTVKYDDSNSPRTGHPDR